MSGIRNKLRLRWVIVLGGFFCFFMINITVNASDAEMADILNDLNLFEGTDQGYELESGASRNQSAVMLVRYLGIEDFVIEAYERGELVHPFVDVPDWASPHVAYLYQTGLANGVALDQYGGSDVVTGNQYATMLLRMLGYQDDLNEFHWTKALEVLSHDYDVDEKILGGLVNAENIGITRGQMVRLSYLTLYFDYKTKGLKVIDSLYYNEVISSSDYKQYNKVKEVTNKSTNEMKAMWISYLDIKSILRDKSAKDFRIEVHTMLNNISDFGMNTIFVQVRPFSDAIYESKVYDWSFIMTGVDGGGLGYDPFEIIVEEANNLDLHIEAWVNPYRIRHDVVKDPLNPNGIIAKMIEDNPELTIQTGNRLMFNPASDRVQNLIVSGVAELVNNYDIDGIHFDDYFYPNADMTLDVIQYEEYLKNGGQLSQAEFRRERINLLIKDVYSTIKSIDSDVVFGVSPQGSTANNYEHTFIDVQKWIDTPGYIDYICPQLYYGFDNETLDFSKVSKEWSQMVAGSQVDLYIGLAGYKIGLVDRWAGTGSQEWITKANRLKFMVELSRSVNNYKGIALFRYDSLFKPTKNVSERVEGERETLKVLFLE